jgi:hypothetical protein
MKTPKAHTLWYNIFSKDIVVVIFSTSNMVTYHKKDYSRRFTKPLQTFLNTYKPC